MTGESEVLVRAVQKYQAAERKHLLKPVTGIPFDESLAKSTADYFTEAKHLPDNPQVKEAYRSLKHDLVNQWNFATKKLGIKFQPWKFGQGQPYANSTEMMKDVRDNKHLYFYTGGNELPAGHPLGAVDPKIGYNYNEIFRAVHDLFGHATHGNQFGSAGERRAFLAHAQMMRTKSVPALAFETHAQNSYFNFGKHLRNEKNEIPKKGEVGYIAPELRPYAPQKAGILPASLSRIEDIRAKDVMKLENQKKMSARIRA